MTDNELINAVKAKPDIRRLLLPTTVGGFGLTDTELTAMISEHKESAVYEVALAYEWDFLIRETTNVTVADQFDYVLKGDDENCLQVADVKYDTGETLLTKKTHAWMNDFLTRNNISSPTYWLDNGRDAGFPEIRIVATPTDGDIQLKYRFWIKEITLSMFPDLFKSLLESAIAKHLIPTYASVFVDDLARAISGYTRSAGGTDIAVLDPVITKGNQRRANLHGWS